MRVEVEQAVRLCTDEVVGRRWSTTGDTHRLRELVDLLYNYKC